MKEGEQKQEQPQIVQKTFGDMEAAFIIQPEEKPQYPSEDNGFNRGLKKGFYEFTSQGENQSQEQQPESEDELWDEVLKQHENWHNDDRTYSQFVDDLKKQFTIKRR